MKIQEGKILALKEIINVYENVITDENDETKEFLELTKRKLEIAKDEFHKLQALAMLHKQLFDNLEQSLVDLDIQQYTRDIVLSVQKDIEDRVKSGKCSFKRPGKEKFPCDNKIKKGERFCTEHKKDFK